MNAKIPSERQILRCIYQMYMPQYPFEAGPDHLGEVMVPIDVPAVAERLGMNKYLLFGYLTTHLDHKWRYKNGNNSYVSLFEPNVGNLRHAINFPYLAAILADHDNEHSKFAWSLGVSLVALALSVGAIIAQLMTS